MESVKKEGEMLGRDKSKQGRQEPSDSTANYVIYRPRVPLGWLERIETDP